MQIIEDMTIEDWPDLMLDLETLGTDPGDAVISIGGRLFDLEGSVLGPGFQINLDIEQLIEMGFGVTGSTIRFWIKQSEAAVQAALDRPASVHEALMSFADILTDGEGGINEGIHVWGNGAAFDNVLLRTMYQRLNLLSPWQWFNDRCFRTMKTQFDPSKALEPKFVGEKHRALDDATHQAKWLINIHNGALLFTGEEPDDEAPAEQEA